MTDSQTAIVPMERVQSRILVIRGQKIILDSDLAGLYGVSTTRLNEQVKRNKSRFPEDFVFQLNKEEFKNLMSQFAISRLSGSDWGGRRKLPYAFTEHGAIMAASVLNSARAVQVSICPGENVIPSERSESRNLFLIDSSAASRQVGAPVEMTKRVF